MRVRIHFGYLVTGITGLLLSIGCMIGYLRHRPERQPIGGFRCKHCGMPGESLGYFTGEEADGYVNEIRPRYNVRDGSIERRRDWEEE